MRCKGSGIFSFHQTFCKLFSTLFSENPIFRWFLNHRWVKQLSNKYAERRSIPRIIIRYRRREWCHSPVPEVSYLVLTGSNELLPHLVLYENQCPRIEGSGLYLCNISRWNRYPSQCSTPYRNPIRGPICLNIILRFTIRALDYHTASILLVSDCKDTTKKWKS